MTDTITLPTTSLVLKEEEKEEVKDSLRITFCCSTTTTIPSSTSLRC